MLRCPGFDCVLILLFTLRKERAMQCFKLPSAEMTSEDGLDMYISWNRAYHLYMEGVFEDLFEIIWSGLHWFGPVSQLDRESCLCNTHVG